MEIYTQTAAPKPQLLLGLPNPGDDYVAIVENIGDKDFNITLHPGTGIYLLKNLATKQE